MSLPKVTRRSLLKTSAIGGLALGLSEGRLAQAATATHNTHIPISEQLSRIRSHCNSPASNNSIRIAVLGGGMAGLASAYELRKCGFDITVFEASQRLGGRVWTKRFNPNEEDHHHHEFGAMRIPASHDYTRHYVGETSLGLRQFVTSHREASAFYRFRSQSSSKIGDAGKAVEDSGDPDSPGRTYYQRLMYRLSAAHHRRISQDYAPSLFGSLLVAAVESLTEEDIESLFGFRRLTETIARLDSMTLGGFVFEGLAKEGSAKNARAALELIGSTTGLAVWWDKSLGMFLRDELTATGTGLEEIVGGMDLLPRKLAELFERHPDIPDENSREIRTSHQIVSISRKQGIDSGKETVCVEFARISYPEGEPLSPELKPNAYQQSDVGSQEFDHVICTIPFPVLRSINISGIDYAKRRAIRNLNYASSAKVLFYTKERFWEGPKYGIVGGASYSDGITRATYYPSDRLAEYNGNLQIDERRLLNRSRSQYAATRPPADVVRDIQGARNKARTAFRSADRSTLPYKQKGVLVASYNWGRDARTMGALTKQQRAMACKQVISSFHPEIFEMVQDSDSVFWDQHPWSRAAFCFMNPGDLHSYYKDAIRPAGHLHFAGEHCSLDQAWIQGALISALRAVEEVVSSEKARS